MASYAFLMLLAAVILVVAFKLWGRPGPDEEPEVGNPAHPDFWMRYDETIEGDEWASEEMLPEDEKGNEELPGDDQEQIKR